MCRVRQASKNLNGVEYNATRVSELMPFMEYDLHKQIMSLSAPALPCPLLAATCLVVFMMLCGLVLMTCIGGLPH